MSGTHRGLRMGKSSAGDGAAEVVFGVAVTAGKLWAGEPENLVHLGGSPTLREQALGDPQVHDAPIGVREAVADVPTFHTILIDFHRCRGRDNDWSGRLESRVGMGREGKSRPSPRACRAQQGLGVWRQTSLGLHDLDPGGVTGVCAPRGLLVGEAGQPSQVTPAGAGWIASIGRRQQLAGGGRHLRFQGLGAEVNPGLQTARAGLHHHAGVMPVSMAAITAGWAPSRSTRT